VGNGGSFVPAVSARLPSFALARVVLATFALDPLNLVLYIWISCAFDEVENAAVGVLDAMCFVDVLFADGRDCVCDWHVVYSLLNVGLCLEDCGPI
jgi:hypothetical protein